VEWILAAWKKKKLDVDNYVLPALRDIVRANKGEPACAQEISERMTKDEAFAVKIADFLKKLLPEEDKIPGLSDTEKTNYFRLKTYIGDSYMAMKKYNEAQAEYQAADGFFKNDSKVKEKLAACYKASGDFASAFAAYGTLIEKKDATAEQKTAWWSSRYDCLRKLAVASKTAALELIEAALKTPNLPPAIKKDLEKLRDELAGKKPLE
jgi:tetratricopeptide (TPR) repeat protein